MRVLIADDDDGLRFFLRKSLEETGRFECDVVPDGRFAVDRIQSDPAGFNAVILDVNMPRLDGLQALKEIKSIDPSIVVIMLTAYADVHHAVHAVREGAFDYISKPVSGDALIAILDSAQRAQSMINSVAFSAPIMTEDGRDIIGNTAQMQKVFSIVSRLSKVETPVLVRGASGTGKELVARAIHFNSSRKNEKFVAINCSAIPENLFESELFGHEKGSFTGAEERKIGKFQHAENGTLFLDEVGDLPLLMQVKLLRILQEKTFSPIGSNREIKANVRIIAATNRPLEDMIQKGQFRDDLFYRLNVIPIFLPSLTERKADIDKMVQMFIKKFNDQQSKSIRGVSPDVLGVLKKYDWPGNIRELENIIEHAFIWTDGPRIELQSLPEDLLKAVGASALSNSFSPSGTWQTEASEDSLKEDSVAVPSEMELDFNKEREKFEKEFIIKALKAFGGRINQTALHANIPKKTLLRKLEKYEINARDYS